MPTVTLISDDELSPEAACVFAEIRSLRGDDFIGNSWRALAHDPALLRRTWDTYREVMAPGELDPLIKELIYVAVSVANGCAYCIQSHAVAAPERFDATGIHGTRGGGRDGERVEQDDHGAASPSRRRVQERVLAGQARPGPWPSPPARVTTGAENAAMGQNMMTLAPSGHPGPSSVGLRDGGKS